MKDQHPSSVLGILKLVGNARFSHNQIGDCSKGKHTAQWPSTIFSAAPLCTSVYNLRLGISGLLRLSLHCRSSSLVALPVGRRISGLY